MSTFWKDDAPGVELDVAGKMPRLGYPKACLLYRFSELGCGLEVV
jgi:hypothetical protein